MRLSGRERSWTISLAVADGQTDDKPDTGRELVPGLRTASRGNEVLIVWPGAAHAPIVVKLNQQAYSVQQQIPTNGVLASKG